MGKFGATRDHGLGSQMCRDVAILGIIAADSGGRQNAEICPPPLCPIGCRSDGSRRRRAQVIHTCQRCVVAMCCLLSTTQTNVANAHEYSKKSSIT